jgi:hypothetical protein
MHTFVRGGENVSGRGVFAVVGLQVFRMVSIGVGGDTWGIYAGGSRIFAHLSEIFLVNIAEGRYVLMVARDGIPLWIAKGAEMCVGHLL